MTNRDLIRMLLELPMDAEPFVGKGMGPLESARAEERQGKSFIILSPAGPISRA